MAYSLAFLRENHYHMAYVFPYFLTLQLASLKPIKTICPKIIQEGEILIRIRGVQFNSNSRRVPWIEGGIEGERGEELSAAFMSHHMHAINSLTYSVTPHQHKRISISASLHLCISPPKGKNPNGVRTTWRAARHLRKKRRSQKE